MVPLTYLPWEHPITKDTERIVKSFGTAIIAYLFLLRACKNEIRPGESWSIFQLRNNFVSEIVTNQIRHTTDLEIKKLKKVS